MVAELELEGLAAKRLAQHLGRAGGRDRGWLSSRAMVDAREAQHLVVNAGRAEDILLQAEGAKAAVRQHARQESTPWPHRTRRADEASLDAPVLTTPLPLSLAVPCPSLFRHQPQLRPCLVLHCGCIPLSGPNSFSTRGHASNCGEQLLHQDPSQPSITRRNDLFNLSYW